MFKNSKIITLIESSAMVETMIRNQMQAKGVVIITVYYVFTDRASEATVVFIPVAIDTVYQTLDCFTNVAFRAMFTGCMINK